MASTEHTELPWTWLGRASYADAWRLQELAREALIADEGAPERLLLVEHPPTVTVGRSGDTTGLLIPPEILAARGIALERSTRGGHLTWHAPGQLVAYPVLHLRRRGLGPREHVAQLIGAVCTWLGGLGVDATWRADAPGAWVLAPPLHRVLDESAEAPASAPAHRRSQPGSDESGGQEPRPRKIASVGVHVHRDVTAHGVAVNLDIDLGGFAVIRPCGFTADVMTSVARERGSSPTVAEAAPSLAAAIAAAYGLAPVRASE